MGDAPATTDPRAGVAPAGRRRLPRRTRVTRAATVVAAALLMLPALAFLALQAALPSDGAHLRPGADAVRPEGLVLSPLTTGGGLLEGDVLVAIADVDVARLVARRLGGTTDTVGVADGAGAAPGGSTDGPADVTALTRAWRHGSTLPYRVLRDGEPRTVQVTLGRHPLAAAVARTWGTIVFALVSLLVAAVVFARRPDHPPARVLFVSAGALVGATTWSLGLHVGDVVHGTGFWLYQLTTVLVFMSYWTSVLHFATVFPRPLWVARSGAFVPLLHLAPVVTLAGFAVPWSRVSAPLDRLAAMAPVSGYYAAAALLLALTASVWQYRRHTTGATRQQIRWVVFAALVAGGAGLSLYIVPPLVGATPVHPNFIGAIVTVFPLTIAVAVLRHNLFDIDVLIQRTLVYGALSVVVATAYVVVVTAFGLVFQARGGLLPALLATGLVAVAFGPVRDRVQRVVSRLMYGQRDDPAAVLAGLGARLEGALAPHAVLPTLVETVARALRLPYVALTLEGAGGAKIAAEYGRAKYPPERFPLVYRGEPIGELVVEPRGREESFTAAEAALLATIARQAGVSAYAVRTAEDLRRSRERLVAAREEERRRLRRDLHDGLGPALAGLTLKLDAAGNLLDRDPAAAHTILRELRRQVEGAIGDLRGIVHALRPPALDDLGLVGALREQTVRHAHERLAIELAAPDPMPAVPAAVEVAAYRIVQEALTNVVRHAGASRCRVTLAAGETLVLTVDDDGAGMPAHRLRSASSDDRGARDGVGLSSMRDRAVELGGTLRVLPRPRGGTRVEARLPLAPPASPTADGDAAGRPDA